MSTEENKRAMSQENVEIVRAVVDAWNRGDWDAVLKDADPSFEFDFTRSVSPGRGLYRLDQMGEYFRQITETWQSLRMEADEFIEVGEQVVMPNTLHAQGRGGIEVQSHSAVIWTIRDGKVVRLCFYQERQEALEAAGLSEQAMSQENGSDASSMSRADVENIGQAYEAMSRLDAEALVTLCDPDVEFRSRIAEADDVTYKGHDGVRDYMASLAEVFEWVRTEPLDVVGISDRAVVCNRFRARGRHSGVEVEERFFQALRFRAGKVVWWAFYPSKTKALEAAGLSEQDAHADS